MSAPFTRTPSGLAEKWRFYDIPTMWVEGPTDILFYEPIVHDLACRFEAFLGAANAKALIEGITTTDYPYGVILDGDYDILSSSRSPHRRVVRLSRYSFENYFWEKEPLNRCCHKHSRSGDRNDVIGAEYDRLTAHIENTLRHAVELDIAARRSDPAPDVLPKRIDMLLVKPFEPDVDSAKVAALTSAVNGSVDVASLEKARKDVALFLKNHRFVDLLNGHLLFGILRYLFTRTVQSVAGRKCVLDDDALTQILSDIVWRSSPAPDHQRLRKKVRAVVRELLPSYKTVKSA